MVWRFLVAMTLAALGYVFAYGWNVPSWDEWDAMPTAVGVQPVTWDWLWSQHNEHRIPVPRLAMLAAYRLVPDVRAGMVLNVAALAAASAWLLLAIRKKKGPLIWTDIFLPLAALHLGQGLNFIWGWQLEFVLSTLFVVALLSRVVRKPSIGGRDLLFVAVLMILLTGTGAHGLVVLPAMALWSVGVAWIGARQSRVGGKTPTVGWVPALATMLLGAALVAIYLHGYEKVPHHPTSPGLRASLLTAVKAVTLSYGGAIRDVWPWSAVWVLGVVGATLGRLAWVMKEQPAERVRAWGIFAFVLAVGSLAAALGLGRDGFEPRYVTLLFPLLWGVYLAWRLYGDGAGGAWMRAGLTLVAVALAWPNTRHGLAYGSDLSARLRAFETEMRSGMPRSELIARHRRVLHPAPELLTDYLPMLRAARWGSFSQLKDDPDFQRIDVPSESWTVTGATWEKGQLRHAGGAVLTYHPPKDRRIAGVEFTYRFSNALNRAPLVRLEWRAPGKPFDDDHWLHWSPTGDRANWDRRSYLRLQGPPQPLVCWLWSDVEELKIRPDYIPGTFALERFTLLLAPR